MNGPGRRDRNSASWSLKSHGAEGLGLKRARRYAAILALGYFVIAAVWVGFSDRMLAAMGLPSVVEHQIELIKGQAFVLVTAALLYGLAYRHLRSLHVSEERYRRLVEGSPDIVYSVSRAHGGLYHSERVREVLGYEPEFLIENPWIWEEWVHPEDRPRFEAATEALYECGEPLDIEYRIRDGAGRWRWVRDRSVGRIPEGDDVIAEGVVTDITDQKEAEAQVRRLNLELEGRVVQRTSELQAANRELEAFSYSVSHDLRAPLRHINGYVELLASRAGSELSESNAHYLEQIGQASRRMGALIDDLLDFSRSGRSEFRPGPVDMGPAVADTIVALAEDLEGRDIEWVIPALPTVMGDANMLRQVWANLLQNAVKYTRDRHPARIEISVETRPDETVFTVTDNGVGFDMRYASKLFGVFERMHGSAEFEGTGVGLANVRRIIDRHGGRTWAEAEVGRGASFHFSIPNRG